MSRFALAVLCNLALALTLATSSSAQISQVDDTTSTPIEGAGHDYIKALSETVNPANGSLSVRIQLPVPKARGLTIPFSIGYDSNSVNHLVPGYYPKYGYVSWAPNTGTLSQGGWTYNFPAASAIGSQVIEGTYPNFYSCNLISSWMFRDATGGMHSLGLGTLFSPDGPCLDGYGGAGGDPQVSATLPNPNTSADQTPYPPSPYKLVVSSEDGTIYNFDVAWGNGTTQIFTLPSSIEDRNGNQVVSASNGFTDTLGRSVISWSGFGPSGSTNSLSVGGLSYQVAWKTTSPNFTVPSTWVGSTNGPNTTGDFCSPIPAVNDSQTVVSKITLPNSQSYYEFYYGMEATPHSAPTNPYGLLSEIDYPYGGWVTYTWKLSDTMNELADYPGEVTEAGTTCSTDPYQFCPAPVQDGCLYQYKTPVVASRNVNFGGSSPSITQTFTTYSTAWSAPLSGNVGGTSWTTKSTAVTTTDSVLGTSQTSFTYTPISVPTQPYSHTSIVSQLPVESSSVYYDWGNSATPLRTVNKTWYNQYDLASETTTEGGKTSKVTYCYVGVNCAPVGISQLQEKDEYDFGASVPARKTVTTYQSFSGTPGVIADAPCKTVVYDGNNNRYAETDYLYDGGSTLCGTVTAGAATTGVTVVSGTHDESKFGPTQTAPRGNLTQKTQWASTGTSPVTTYTYYETGQVFKETDPCGNGTCSDMTGSAHTTTYSYIDSYATGGSTCISANGPAGNTNGYLTQVVYPSTNGVVHSECFSYDYNSGQLTGTKDENSQLTAYTYSDPFLRPTLANYPDGGQLTIGYNDAAPSPSVTSTKLISSSVSLSTTTVMDGVGHVVETEVTTDPEGADDIDTAYDGTGSVHTRSNPHRSSTLPTDGTTTYTYDALGRTVLVQQPDGSSSRTVYDQTCSASANAVGTMVTDEAGNSRKSCSDGLGRLIEVDEPGAGATIPIAGSGTVTISGSEQTKSATPGTGSATISNNGLGCINNGHGGYYATSGTVWITVTGGITSTGTSNFGGSCDPNGIFTMGQSLASIASNIASGLTTSSAGGVTATSNGTTIQIIANSTGVGTDYPVSWGYTSNGGGYVAASVPGTLTGGNNTAISDSGTVSITVDGFTASVTFNSSTYNTAQQIASSLASTLNASSAVEASASGAIIKLTAADPGSDSNYTLSTADTWDTQYFTNPSFTAAASGSTVTGGVDGTLGNNPLVTQYAYDPLNNLLCAVQKGSDTTAFSTCASASATWRPRSFAYDSLSRLSSATNPESGTVTYTYDANSNISTRIEPKANTPGSTALTTSTYSYDALNRLLSKVHADPINANSYYGYDGTAISSCPGPVPPSITSPTNLLHRRSAMCTIQSASSWSYDQMGRPLVEARTNVGPPIKKLNVSYTYYKDGSLNTLTYPSGDVVTYIVGGAGRPIQVTDSANNYVTAATYAPHGALTGMTNGAGIVTKNVYSDRLQPILLSAGVTGQNPFFSLCYDFHLHVAVNSSPCTFNAYTTGDNGNIFQILNKVDPTRSAVFTYDSLNRISQANTINTTSANCWGEVYTIDAWGSLTNRAAPSGMSGSCSTEGLSATATTQNQLSGIGLVYDPAGNVVNDGLGNTPTYDAENRIVTDAGVNYYYDADGVRINKSSGTMYWPGPGGEVLTEATLSGTINEEYVYFNGARIARVDRPSGTVNYYFSDKLGSASVIASSTGTVQEQYFYYPYGGIQSSTGSDPNHYKFTGKERDSESGLDMFGARYYGSSLGRFMTPDWSASSNPDPVPYADLRNPQSLNLYSYTKNNPTTLTDPNGHCDVDGEHHNWVWCAAHAIGITETQKEEADQARANLAGVKNITINGQTVQDFLKGATNQQVLIAQRSIVEFLTAEATNYPCGRGVSCGIVFPVDFPTKGTVNWSASFESEGEARSFARTKLGSDAVEVEPGKWRSADGKWQYRAKPGDVSENHIHLEQLNPQTGEVIQNLHLRWPEGTGR